MFVLILNTPWSKTDFDHHKIKNINIILWPTPERFNFTKTIQAYRLRLQQSWRYYFWTYNVLENFLLTAIFTFDNWLERQDKNLFNSLAEIILTQKAITKH